MKIKYRGLYTFDAGNHKYVPVVSANGIVDLLDTTSYVPSETLIEDNKLKEIFREWGKVIGIDGKTTFNVTHHNHNRITETTLFQSRDDFLFTIELPGRFGNYGGIYTLEQIIGDKE